MAAQGSCGHDTDAPAGEVLLFLLAHHVQNWNIGEDCGESSQEHFIPDIVDSLML